MQSSLRSLGSLWVNSSVLVLDLSIVAGRWQWRMWSREAFQYIKCRTQVFNPRQHLSSIESSSEKLLYFSKLKLNVVHASAGR